MSLLLLFLHLLDGLYLYCVLVIDNGVFVYTLPLPDCRNSQLQEQLQALKKKEAEETKALEDMIAKVEENLVTSTVSNLCVFFLCMCVKTASAYILH